MTHTLTHTHMSTPTPVRISDYQAALTSGWATYRLVLHIGGSAAGTVEDRGNGGGAWFYQASPQGREAFDELLSQSKDHDGQPFTDEEALCNRLGDEAQIAKDVTRANRARGIFAIRFTTEDGDLTTRTLTHEPWAGTYPQPHQLADLHLPTGAVAMAVWHGARKGWVNFYPRPGK